MIDIGLKLKEKREENGVSVEEVAEDLKVRPSQIVNLEEGKREEFKDVVFLKYFIRDYAKYLGLNSDNLVDEFNEFLFDYTSKIPLEEIEKARLGIINKKEVVSPYTNSGYSKKYIKQWNTNAFLEYGIGIRCNRTIFLLCNWRSICIFKFIISNG